MTPDPFGRADRPGPRPGWQLAAPRISPSGIPAGTVVLTADGELPVEFLTPGDRIVTRDAGMVRLTGIARQTSTVRMTLFAAGSLGHTRPGQDLILPADQPVLIRDWRAAALTGQTRALVPAGALTDGEFIRDLGRRRLCLHLLRFARPQVIYAGGMELAGATMDDAAMDDAA